jgi:hypothetical protein
MFCNTQSGCKQSWNSGSVDLNGPINLQAVHCNFAQLPLHVDCPVCAKQGFSCVDVEAVQVWVVVRVGFVQATRYLRSPTLVRPRRLPPN